MIGGWIGIFGALFNRILNGDLVIHNMVSQFSKYLNENKINNANDTFRINDKIEFYPNMIKSLYKFLQ